jgi:hypothetical protein
MVVITVWQNALHSEAGSENEALSRNLAPMGGQLSFD